MHARTTNDSLDMLERPDTQSEEVILSKMFCHPSIKETVQSGLPRHQEEEYTDKIKQAQTEQTTEKH